MLRFMESMIIRRGYKTCSLLLMIEFIEYSIFFYFFCTRKKYFTDCLLPVGYLLSNNEPAANFTYIQMKSDKCYRI